MKIVRDSAPATPDSARAGRRHPWQLLVVDDEPDVRAITRLNLHGFSFADRQLEIIEADSFASACAKLAEHPDIAVALIDVVMDSDDAGLRLVDHIRKELGNETLRIVIRTGQPGAAPERHVIDNYDIDDYKDKTELSATRLYTTVRSAIKAYRDLRAIDLNRAGLEIVLQAAPDIYRLANTSLHDFFAGILTQIVGLCQLSEASHISTTEGLIATFDAAGRHLEAATGGLATHPRFDEIHRQCVAAIEDDIEPRKLRANSLLIPLLRSGEANGYIFVEPLQPLPANDERLVRIMARQCQSALENLYLHIDLIAAFDKATEMLAEIAEFKDKTTGGHIGRLHRYTRALAIELGIGRDEAERWGKASQLHDVGKIGIADEVLRKPGKLSPGEFAAMQRHTTIGASILGHHEALALARDIALHHHERWDGKGYPDGIAAGELPLATRIVSVADVFDALTSHRPYKAPWPGDAARQVIADGAGTQFDPQVVDAFLRAYDRGDFAQIIDEAAHSRGDDMQESAPAAAAAGATTKETT